MKNIATITSKRQLTIPVEIYKNLELESGDKLIVKEMEGSLVLTKASDFVESMAGSVSIPKHLKGKDLDEAIKNSKSNYFGRRN